MSQWETIIDAVQKQNLVVGNQTGESLLREAQRGANEDLCTVAFLGEWSRGKTSLLNSLLGNEWLPTDVRPTTASIVTIVEGESRNAKIVRTNGDNEFREINHDVLRLVQTEETGGLHSSDIVRVDLERDLGELEDLRLVDTPGVNDLQDTPEELVYKFLPFVDLGVFVLDGSSGGLSGSEKAFLESRVLGRYAPRLLFFVNRMDVVEFEDDEEAAEFKDEIVSELESLLGKKPVYIFGTAKPSLESTASSVAELKSELLAVAKISVEQRREQFAYNLVADLIALHSEQLKILQLESSALRNQYNALIKGKAGMEAGFEMFRKHIHKAGYEPLEPMIDASLNEFRRTSIQYFERQLALTGQLGAYAEHGLKVDLETLVRNWVDRHLPELKSYLQRHTSFVNVEYMRNFGGSSSLAPARLGFRMPAGNFNPLLNSSGIRQREKSSEEQRFIVPGVMAVVGGMIALPLGAAGLFIGHKIAADLKKTEEAAARVELRAAALKMIDANIHKMKTDLCESLASYFHDFDSQLLRVFGSRLAAMEHQLKSAQDERDKTGEENSEAIARIKKAQAILKTLVQTQPK